MKPGRKPIEPRVTALETRTAEIEAQLALVKQMLSGPPSGKFVVTDCTAQYQAQFERWPGNGG